MATSSDFYARVAGKAKDIETSLKNLGWWDAQPLSEDKYEDMGAFGCNTMTFAQWLQFILLVRIDKIIKDKEDFPTGSTLGTYAVREFDGMPETEYLQKVLEELDTIINSVNGDNGSYDYTSDERGMPLENVPDQPGDRTLIKTVGLGDTVIPQVVYTLAKLLPQFKGADLESQLQTYDTFVAILSPSVRPAIARLLTEGAKLHPDADSKARIEKAAKSILEGGRAAEPYDHDASMEAYKAQHRKNFPNLYKD